jgi:hypothetical protein
MIDVGVNILVRWKNEQKKRGTFLVGIHDQKRLLWMEEAYLHIMGKEIVETEKRKDNIN